MKKLFVLFLFLFCAKIEAQVNAKSIYHKNKLIAYLVYHYKGDSLVNCERTQNYEYVVSILSKKLRLMHHLIKEKDCECLLKEGEYTKFHVRDNKKRKIF